MIKEFVDAWYTNRAKLEEYFKIHEMREYSSYENLVHLLFEVVINPYMESLNDYRHKPFALIDEYNHSEITVLDHSEYQGSLIFILHERDYAPDPRQYITTTCDYGSCSGCDTLMHCQEYGGGLPNDEQVRGHMMMCLHLLQKCKYIYSDEEWDELYHIENDSDMKEEAWLHGEIPVQK